MEKVSLKEKISYGLGSMGYNIANASLATFILPFYQTFGPEFYGIIILIITFSKLFDIISDIIFGYIVDNTKTKLGKSRPYLLFLSIPFMIILSLTFINPFSFGIGNFLSYLYIIITYNLLTTIVYTGINISHSTLNLRITDNIKERQILNLFRVYGAFICTILINNITYPLINIFNWQITWTIYGIFGMIFFILCFKGTKERIFIKNNYKIKELKNIISKNYIISLLSYMFLILKRSLVTIPLVFFASSWFHSPFLVGLFTISFMVPMTIAIGFTPKIFRFEKSKVLIITNIIYILSCSLILFFGLYLNFIPLVLLIICFIINGIMMAPHEVSSHLFFIDIIEENFEKNSVKIEGLIFSGAAIIKKIGESISYFIVGLLTISFIQTNISNSIPILILFTIVPIIISFGTIFIMCFYKNRYELEYLKN